MEGTGIITMATITTIIMTITTHMSIELNPLSLLHLLHSASPALPVGAFAYSQGLEYALDAGWCKTAQEVDAWLETLLQSGLGTLDLPILVRLHQAWSAQDLAAVNHWNALLLAFRETRELYQEDVQVGEAFRQWHLKQHPELAATLANLKHPTVASMFSLNAVRNGVAEHACLLGFGWSWLENQIIAASKAMPMGQSDGQKILHRLIPVLAEAVEQAMRLDNDDIGSSCMGQAMASALHEHQYSRLFRS
jgi:urease accessory protein